MTLRIPLERSRSFNRNLTKKCASTVWKHHTCSTCIGYDVPQTLILIGIFTGRIIVVSCIVILKFATMATEIYERRRLNFETSTH